MHISARKIFIGILSYEEMSLYICSVVLVVFVLRNTLFYSYTGDTAYQFTSTPLRDVLSSQQKNALFSYFILFFLPPFLPRLHFNYEHIIAKNIKFRQYLHNFFLNKITGKDGIRENFCCIFFFFNYPLTHFLPLSKIKSNGKYYEK